LTSQVELGASAGAVKRALLGSVLALAGFYMALCVGFSCMGKISAAPGELIVPQLMLAERLGGAALAIPVVLLSLLASFTSYNGALLTLSRFTYALATQRVLPRGLARVDPHSLVARGALDVLLLVAVGATALVQLARVIEPLILAAAVSAAASFAA